VLRVEHLSRLHLLHLVLHHRLLARDAHA
jgi:hypothetical protein